MIDVNELRSGVTFTMDGELYKVLEYQHYKPGRGKAIQQHRRAAECVGLKDDPQCLLRESAPRCSQCCTYLGWVVGIVIYHGDPCSLSLDLESARRSAEPGQCGCGNADVHS